MTQNDMQATLNQFYARALSAQPDNPSTAVLEQVLSDDFQSVNSQETKDKHTLIRQMAFILKLVPDMRWEPQDMLFATDGHRAVVRSIATGTPVGNFMGVECDGSRSFRMDATDIHEFAHGKIVRVHHLEDWATALRQLRG